MITVLIAAVAVAVALAGLLAVRYFSEFGKHAGGGEGALTVEQLLAQADAEDEPGGRHRLREPVVIRGDLADDLAVVETRLLSRASAGVPFDNPDIMATHRWTLRHLLVGLQNL
ncbi:hypothetical protein AB0L88_24775 [Saccharopolyspora shandongensis]|uniref:Uncharacterized protein n=1 Tax=Saccharopolyspora shandongensis TaxID=418495 RepID=A0A1H3T5K6_9PSEU|nr:hypothetical protein [Saccharopolyspora shandongensis]SDZ45005.1 hypothetical protein SAMN05216215_10759 [Saccharopolyspora shandongensis]